MRTLASPTGDTRSDGPIRLVPERPDERNQPNGG